MTKQEILDAFIQAEKDWSKPIGWAQTTNTHWGLCRYFISHMGFSLEQIEEYLQPCWTKYETKEYGWYHFNGFGNEPQGRAERLDVIRKVINDLKSELG
jgi:hypothetical protein